MKSITKRHSFMLFSLTFLWIKTLIISMTTFQLTINYFLEAVTFILSPLVFLVVVFGLGLYFKPKWQGYYFLFISVLLTIVLYSNAVYYREFSDIITLPMLLMSGNMGDLSTSIIELIHWYDVFFFLDLFIIGYFIWKKPKWVRFEKITFQQSKAAVVVILVIITISIAQVSTLDRAQAFNRTFLVQSLGLYNFYIYDAFVQTQTSVQTVFAEENDWTNINKHLDENRVAPNDDMFGIAKDMNVIVVSLESVESFVIGEELNGQEITPFLNELIEDSFYFDNFYYQTGQGKTSDAEFLINNSLYPLGRGAVFLTHDQNEYRALPETLTNYGYETANFHANDRSFYNRDVMYPNLGYNRIYSFSDYDISMRNSVGWGMKDIDFVEQSMDYITELPEPFYSTLLTLTNHFPYHLDEEDHFIEPFNSNSNIVNQYFPTVRYTDEAMRILVDQLKEEGLYENTALIMYGDHYGIANSHYDELSKFLGKEINLYEAVKLERVPLIIHIPGVDGKTISTISGQVDVMPSLLNLLGIPEDDHVMFGNDLFAENREEFAVLRDGTAISNELISVNGSCLSYTTGEEFPLEKCDSLREKGEEALFYSDKIIYGDLFRFN
ncbi:LTA synthase family protein [Evansella cellulosilytica]|uniref:Sulfatase n=1 Tax=Evansella cellulosilytica (strain ATCC 21833 / DSM 2522 / FERM P-1141 / JCM 9156 / N-4) TaxID=649639 RepID=E6TQT1_EVAC2|nr:LTA synthase family protein [Evansella cellulosilytica]ADU31706.1 sulfatase [Evansella cellulosilytica DSM 2522]